MPPNEIVKPANADELNKAMKQRGWKFLETRELVNREDVRELHRHAGAMVSRGKKLCVALIERE